MLALMLTISAGLQAQEKTISKSFQGIKEIKLNTASGDLKIVKGGDNKVDVELVYSYDDDVFEAIMEQDGDDLDLEEKFERNTSSRGSSKWKITVPENIDIDFNTGSGDLEANSLALELKSNSGSGDVDFENVSGHVKINTGSGNFKAESFDGDLKVNAGSGDVSLSESKGEFSVNLGSGDIQAETLTGEISMNVGRGDIDVRGISLTGSSSFNSGSGDARVVLTSPLKNNISVNSGSGNATLDFNGQKLEGEFTMKANKRNGEISAPFKFDSETEEDHGDQTTMKKVAKIGNSNVQIKVSTGSGRATIEK